METIRRFCSLHSLTLNIFTNLALALICLPSYGVLIALYLTQGLGVQSFTYIQLDKGQTSILPTAVVPVLGVLLVGATSALLTRSVEHDVWIRLRRSANGPETLRPLTADESHRRAQWSVSPFARLVYTFTGKSWMLRLSGLLLFGTAVLSPVLLLGIQTGTWRLEHIEDPMPSQPRWAGFIQNVDDGSYYDFSTEVASILSINNVTVPASSICKTADCSARAHAMSLKASCVSETQNWRIPSHSERTEPRTYCSKLGKKVCVEENLSQNLKAQVFANFTTGASDECEDRKGFSITDTEFECPAGDFAVIFGAWNTGAGSAAGAFLHSVDCHLQYGSIIVSQNGSNPPTLDRGSFTVFSEPIRHDENSTDGIVIDAENPPARTTLDGRAWGWQMRYILHDGDWTYGNDPPPGLAVNPYTFSTNLSLTIGTSPLGRSLLASKDYQSWPTDNPNTVARDIEKNFNMATLQAFVRQPRAARLEVLTTSERAIWTYDSRVLSILAVPLLATLLALSACWRVGSNDVVLGYNPIEIARRGDEILGVASADEDQGEAKGSAGVRMATKGIYTAVRDE